MIGQLSYTTFNTIMGWVGILGSSNGIRRTTLPQPSAQDARRILGKPLDYAEPAPNLFQDLRERFQAYFNGDKVDFPDEFDLPDTTPFQRQVWEVTRLIPYGETRSYKWVAEQIGKSRASRAAGQALAKNPLPILIPCHRVINTNGRLGGFGSGLEMKRRLLHLEAQAQ